MKCYTAFMGKENTPEKFIINSRQDVKIFDFFKLHFITPKTFKIPCIYVSETNSYL